MEEFVASWIFLTDEEAPLDDEALVGRERGRDGWSSTPALL